MIILKFVLWFLLVAAFLTPTKERTTSEKWMFTAEFSAVILCLTLLYSFGNN